MADKIDQLKIGSTSYDIDLPPDATPSIASLTVGGSSVLTEGYLGFTVSGKNYPVEKSSGSKLYVNVPWENTWPTNYLVSASKSDSTLTVTDNAGNSYSLTDNNTTYNFSGTTFYSGNQNNAEHNANNAVKNGNYYYSSNGPTTSLGASTADGALYVQSYSDSWVGQIAQDYRNGRLFVRGRNNGTWQDWVRIANYSEIPTNTNQLTNGAGFITSSGSCASATNADYATSAGSANSATTADSASTAGYATSAGSAGSTTLLAYQDTRDTAVTVANAVDYNGIKIEFKNKSKSNIPSTGTWTALITLDGYGDSSGGYPSQLGFSMTDLGAGRRLYMRSPKDTSSWGDWQTIAFTGDIPTNTNQLTNGAGFITGISKDDVTTALGYTPPEQDTTYSAATQSADGLMSAADKKKLDGVEAGANNYSHPAYDAVNAGLYRVGRDASGHVTFGDSFSIPTSLPADGGTAAALSTNAGSTTQPVYFDNGIPVATTYSLAKSVPADAKFTDTTYESKSAAQNGTDVSLVTTGEKYTWNNKSNLTLAGNGSATTASRSDHTHSQYFNNSGGYALDAYSGDFSTNVTIGDSVNGWEFNSNGTMASKYMNIAGDVGIVFNQDVLITGTDGYAGSTTTSDLVVQNGNVYANYFYAGSDIRLKENIEDTNLDSNKLLDSLHIVDFNYKDDQDKKLTIGLIAQELEAILPEKYHDSFIQIKHKDENNYLNINETKLVYVALLALKDQKKKIDDLELRIKALESR